MDRQSIERAALRQARRLQGLFAGGLGILLAVVAAGCPEPADQADGPAGGSNLGGSTGGGGVAATEPCEQACVTKIFTGSPTACKLCHYANMPNATPPLLSLGDLDLVSPGVTSRLRDVAAKHTGITPAAGVTPMCPSGDKLLDTANPGNSWFLKKLRMQQGTCGDKMPSSGNLTAEEIACLDTYAQCVTKAAGPITTSAGGSGGAASAGGGAGGASGGMVAATGGNGGTGGT